MSSDPIQISPEDFDNDVALGLAFPMPDSNSATFQSNYYTKDQVKSNILCLFSTMIGERIMEPEFGTKLWEFIFEPNHQAGNLHSKIMQELKRALSRWLPQVRILNLELKPEDEKLKVIVKYDVPNYNIEDEVTLEA